MLINLVPKSRAAVDLPTTNQKENTEIVTAICNQFLFGFKEKNVYFCDSVSPQIDTREGFWVKKE